MNEDLQGRLRKARRSLRRAHRDLEDADHDFAVSGAYYAMFHAAAALLALRGLTFSKHSGVISAINREFVRTGELDRGYFEALEAAFRERNAADYGYEESITAETARTIIANAEKFVDMVEAKLGG